MAKRLRYKFHWDKFKPCKTCFRDSWMVGRMKDYWGVPPVGIYLSNIWIGPFCSATCFKKWRDAPAKA